MAYIESVEQDRLTIPTCIGCGAMREYESCVACTERKLELVNGTAYDDLTAAAAARRARIRSLRVIVDELARAEPTQHSGPVVYELLRDRARLVLGQLEPVPGNSSVDLATAAEPTVVWRCSECGGVDAPQECLGVCIWRPIDWVDARAFETERVRASGESAFERSLFGLVNRFAHVAPRDGEWERNWRVFQGQARQLLES